LFICGCSKTLKPPIVINNEEYENITNWRTNHNDSVKALFNTTLYMDYDTVNANIKMYFNTYKITCYDSTSYIVKYFKHKKCKFDIIIRNKYNYSQKLISQLLYFHTDTSKYSKEMFIESVEMFICDNFGEKRYTSKEDPRIWWIDGRREIIEGTYNNGGISFILQFQAVDGGDYTKLPRLPAFLPCR
jgi:hypothetical protein